MEYIIQYIMDKVGYSKTFKASSEEKARDMLKEEIVTHYPMAVCTIVAVDKVEKKSKEAKNEK